MYRTFFIFTFILISFTIQMAPAYAKRLALVIGNDRYQNLDDTSQLERAGNDARAVSRSLSRLGFRVISGFDLGRSGMNQKIADISEQITPGDEIVFFFAGHGVAINGQNYLLPSDVPNTSRETLLKSESILVDEISQTFKQKGARISLLILDACRNNPFMDKKGRSIGSKRGLAGIDAPGSGTMVLFSAGAGQEALDSLSKVPDNHKNSVFTRTLIPLMETKGLEIHRLAREVRKQVHALAKQDHHVQIPASYDEIIEDYYLAGQGNKSTDKSKVAIVVPKPNLNREIHVEPDNKGTENEEQDDWVKTLIPPCRRDLPLWKKRASYGAFAVSSTGNCGWSWSAKNLAEAKKTALSVCSRAAPNCRIVLTHTDQLGDWSLVPVCQEALLKWRTYPGRKAFAVSRAGSCGWIHSVRSIYQARKLAISECRKYGGKECRIHEQE